jgi:hypothetical protein
MVCCSAFGGMLHGWSGSCPSRRNEFWLMTVSCPAGTQPKDSTLHDRRAAGQVVYSAVFFASPGAGYRLPGVIPSSIPRTYLFAGTLEPFFLENTRRWAIALRDARAEVVMTKRIGSQGGAF